LPLPPVALLRLPGLSNSHGRAPGTSLDTVQPSGVDVPSNECVEPLNFLV